MKKNELVIIGHRGARGACPENTLPSVMAAVEAGVDGIEVDLLGTIEGEIILHHDFYLNSRLCRHFDGTPIENTKLICDTPYEEIKKIDCGALPHPEFPGQTLVPGTPIPRLQEVFDALKKHPHPHARHVTLNLEIKADPATPHYILDIPKLVETITDLVKENSYNDKVYYSSFDPNILKEIRRQDPHATTAFLFDSDTLEFLHINLSEWVDYAIQIGKELHAKVISPDYVLLNETNIHTLKNKGFRLITWTVNDYIICKELISQGVDGIITDYPFELIQLLRKEDVLL